MTAGKGLKTRIKNLTVTAVFAAVLCVLCPLCLPIGAVPLSLSIFAVCTVAAVLEYKGLASVIIYIVLGGCGLPVFAFFSGGMGVLTGATGGFIIGYVPLAACTALAVKAKTKYKKILFAALGLACCYACGLLWFMAAIEKDFLKALTASVLPFVAGDIFKIVCGITAGEKAKKILKKSHLHGG